jgi:hypothetical protein
MVKLVGSTITSFLLSQALLVFTSSLKLSLWDISFFLQFCSCCLPSFIHSDDQWEDITCDEQVEEQGFQSELSEPLEVKVVTGMTECKNPRTCVNKKQVKRFC